MVLEQTRKGQSPSPTQYPNRRRNRHVPRTPIPGGILKAFDAPKPSPLDIFSEAQINAAIEVIHGDIMHELKERWVWWWRRRRVPRPQRQLLEQIVQTLGITRAGQKVQITRMMRNKVNDQIHSVLPEALGIVGKTYTGRNHYTLACNLQEQEANVKGIILALNCKYETISRYHPAA